MRSRSLLTAMLFLFIFGHIGAGLVNHFGGDQARKDLLSVIGLTILILVSILILIYDSRKTKQREREADRVIKEALKEKEL